MYTAYVGLGANMGQPAATLDQAVQALAQSDGIQRVTVSPYYRSAPVQAIGPDFVNAVARVCTTLAPLALLRVLQAIEQRFGRERPYKNAPRTLDLDLLLYEDRTIETSSLTLPHPRMHERAFVLRPLLDLDPTIAWKAGHARDLLALCADQEIERLARPAGEP